MKIITCFALCMWLWNADTQKMDLVEHTYQDSLSSCLKNRRVAERSIEPTRVKFACGEVRSQVEYIKEEGQTVGRTRIIKVIDHGYKDAY